MQVLLVNVVVLHQLQLHSVNVKVTSSVHGPNLGWSFCSARQLLICFIYELGCIQFSASCVTHLPSSLLLCKKLSKDLKRSSWTTQSALCSQKLKTHDAHSSPMLGDEWGLSVSRNCKATLRGRRQYILRLLYALMLVEKRPCPRSGRNHMCTVSLTNYS